jgi:hypothetical protein
MVYAPKICTAMNCQICGELEDFIVECKVCGKSFCEYCGDQEQRLCVNCLKETRTK